MQDTIYTSELVVGLYCSNEQSENEENHSIYNSMKKSHNKFKGQELYILNSLLKKLKDMNKWKYIPCSRIKGLNIVKAIFPNWSTGSKQPLPKFQQPFLQKWSS